MSAQPLEVEVDDEHPTWTVDELAAAVGITVRTIRYYATLGLVPPPERRGRVAFYDDRHRARLELIRTMQDQGLSLAAIEQHLARLHAEAPVSEIEMRRALVSSWAPVPFVAVDPHELDRRAGRPLSEQDRLLLQRLGTIQPVGAQYLVGPTFEVGVDLLDLDIPVESMEAAGAAIRAHMDQLILELRDILRLKVLPPLRDRRVDADAELFSQTMVRLRQLTFDALIGNFQQAANSLVDGSLLDQPDA